jgi:hypothetical protein
MPGYGPLWPQELDAAATSLRSLILTKDEHNVKTGVLDVTMDVSLDPNKR